MQQRSVMFPVPHVTDEMVAVVQIISQERILEHGIVVVDVPMPENLEENAEAVTLVSEYRLRQGTSQHNVELFVPQIIEEIVEVVNGAATHCEEGHHFSRAIM